MMPISAFIHCSSAELKFGPTYRLLHRDRAKARSYVHLSQPVPTCPNVSQRLSTSFNASQPLATLQNPLDDDAPIATPQIARGDLGIVLEQDQILVRDRL